MITAETIVNNITGETTQNVIEASTPVNLTLNSAINSTRDPLVTDDIDTPITIGHIWVNTTTQNVFICTDNTAGAAVWKRQYSSLCLDDKFYLDGLHQLVNAKVFEATIPFDCYVVAFSCAMKEQRTTGSLSLGLAKNGTMLTDALNLQINGTIVLDQKKSVAYGTSGFSITAGNKLQVYANSETFTPLANVCSFNIVLER